MVFPNCEALLGGLELAQKRLQDVTTDLDNFDKRMDDLLHIATNFNYPEESGKCQRFLLGSSIHRLIPMGSYGE